MSDSDVKRTSTTRAKPKTFYSQRMPRGVIETCFSDVVTGEIGKLAEEEFFALLRPGEIVRIWFVDTTSVTGFKMDIKESGAHFVERFRKQGGQTMVVVITKGHIRLMAATIALIAGFKMDIFDSRERALVYLWKEVVPKLEGDTL